MAAASSSSTSTISSTCEVFLNFRGELRNTFISFLHKDLKEKGINVFLDSTDIWTGERIDKKLVAAIQGSQISIPVFSEHYADSRWCLMELVEIVKCHKSNGQLVLPIFFYVDPSDVRHQKKGSFAEAFQKHEKKFESHIVEGWRDALKEIGNLTGEVVDDTKNQADLVDLVVKRVLCELNNNNPLVVCKHPIGVDFQVDKLVSLLDFCSNDVQFVGIWGVGGIGKTTIAKAVYNNYFISTFNKHSFISDIREQATKNGLVSLQQQLLKDIFQLDIDISNCDRGKRLIEERLHNQKVFIVLDDVDSQEQIDALVGKTNWFGKGSRIIITSRDWEILSKAKVNEDKIYTPQELNHNQSLQLFSLHAFTSDLPPDNFLQLSKDVVSYSGGLPLTLEVLGSLLSDTRSIEEWKSTLRHLKEIPPKGVQQRLRISYEKLDDYQKEIFLDVACHFIGREKGEVTSIWEACGYHAISWAIRILTKRSLIKFEDKDGDGTFVVLKMHDHIRDMGRDIVREENRMDPSKRSRLWSCDDILQILENNKGTDMIQSIVIPLDLPNVCLNQRHLDKMPNLKFLDISSRGVKGNFCSLPSMLRWFRWTNCSWKVIRTNFYHKGLVHLELDGFRIQQAWNTSPIDKNKRFQKLKVLELTYCGNLSVSPNFSWFPYLEELYLIRCDSLESLDESIGQLSQLKILTIKHCCRMMELPNSIGNLKSLLQLQLWDVRIKELPNSIGNLGCLVRLDLSWTRIEELPNSIGNIESLLKLHLSGTRIKDLPNSIGNLTSLVELDLSNTGIEQCPNFIGNLESLVELNLSFTPIKVLPDNILKLSYLKDLDLRGCLLLKKLPEHIGDLKNLVKLRLNADDKEEGLYPKFKHDDDDKGIEELPDSVGLLENLEVLNTSGCCRVVKLPRSMRRMRHLHTLDLTRTNISKLPNNFSMLSNLEVLRMSGSLKSFPVDLSHFNKLRILQFAQCKMLEKLPKVDISRLRCLKVLRLLDCEKLKETQGLERTESLDDIEVIKCNNLTSDTKRNIHGQGKLLLPADSQEEDYRFVLIVRV